MSEIPRPKFCVGQLVRVVCACGCGLFIDRTEVCEMEYMTDAELIEGSTGKTGIYSGFVYSVSEISGEWYIEPALHAVSPDDASGWSNCIWQPELDGVAE